MMDWLRWHHGSVTDPKFQLVARKAGASLPDVLAVWAFLLETASQSEERGTISGIDAESLDCLFGFPATETRTANVIGALAARGMIDGNRVVSWDKRQPKRERDDSSAARVREHRDRKSENGIQIHEQIQRHTGDETHVTPCNAIDNQETPRLDKIRLEKKQQKQDQKTLRPSLREDADTELAKLLTGIPADLLSDYKKVRKAKKAALTASAVRGLIAAGSRAGKSLSEVLKVCCEESWVGYNHEWQRASERNASGGGMIRAGPESSGQVGKVLSGILALEAMKNGG